MKYVEARSNIKSGDLIAFSHGDWTSISGIKTNVVRIATRSTYSHVGVAWVIGSRVFVLEAVKPKLRIYPLSQSGPFYLLPMSARWLPETEEFALQCVGIDYSEWSAEKAYFDKLESGKVNECAAYIREIYRKDGIYLEGRPTPDTMVLAAQTLGAPMHYVIQ